MIKSVNHFTKLLPPACDFGFEFALRDLYVPVNAINGLTEKILERLTHADNNWRFNNRTDFIVTLINAFRK